MRRPREPLAGRFGRTARKPPGNSARFLGFCGAAFRRRKPAASCKARHGRERPPLPELPSAGEIRPASSSLHGARRAARRPQRACQWPAPAALCRRPAPSLAAARSAPDPCVDRAEVGSAARTPSRVTRACREGCGASSPRWPGRLALMSVLDEARAPDMLALCPSPCPCLEELPRGGRHGSATTSFRRSRRSPSGSSTGGGVSASGRVRSSTGTHHPASSTTPCSGTSRPRERSDEP